MFMSIDNFMKGSGYFSVSGKINFKAILQLIICDWSISVTY